MSKQAKELRKQKFSKIHQLPEGVISNTKKKRQALKQSKREAIGGEPITLESGERINGKGDVIVEKGSGHPDRVHKKSTRGLGMFAAAAIREENDYKQFRYQCNVKLPGAHNRLKNEMLTPLTRAVVMNKQPLPTREEKEVFLFDGGVMTYDLKECPLLLTNAQQTSSLIQEVDKVYLASKVLKNKVARDDFMLYVFCALELIQSKTNEIHKHVFPGHLNSIFHQIRLPKEIWTVILEKYISFVTTSGLFMVMKPLTYTLYGSAFDWFATFSMEEVKHLKLEDASMSVREVNGTFTKVGLPFQGDIVGLKDILLNTDNMLKLISDYYSTSMARMYKGLTWFIAAMNQVLAPIEECVIAEYKANCSYSKLFFVQTLSDKEMNYPLFTSGGSSRKGRVCVKQPNLCVLKRRVDGAVRKTIGPAARQRHDEWIQSLDWADRVPFGT